MRKKRHRRPAQHQREQTTLVTTSNGELPPLIHTGAASRAVTKSMIHQTIHDYVGEIPRPAPFKKIKNKHLNKSFHSSSPSDRDSPNLEKAYMRPLKNSGLSKPQVEAHPHHHSTGKKYHKAHPHSSRNAYGGDIMTQILQIKQKVNF